MFEKYIDAISKSLLFNNIDIENVLEMLKCLEPKLKSYKKNDYIFIAGDPYKHMGIMIEGTAAVLKELTDGERVIITTLKKGDVFGETIAFSSPSMSRELCKMRSEKVIDFHLKSFSILDIKALKSMSTI